MLSLCQGNELHELADHLFDELQQNPLSNPLIPEIFVVQNYGMSRWLSLNMAEKKGIAANLKFEFPAERMWHLFRLIDADIPQTLPSDRQPMAFSIMQLLNEIASAPVFRPIQNYIARSSPEMRQLRCWKLSEKIADAFDQYLVYRPEMLLKWQKGKLATLNPSEQWQAELWRKLTTTWKQAAEDKQQNWTHRAELQQELFSLIDSDSFNAEALPQRITIFDISTLPPPFIKTFVKLSKLIDVHFYRSMPVNESSQNALTESMAGEGREFMQLFKDAVNKDPEVKENFRTVIVGDEKRKPKSLLQNLQVGINEDAESRCDVKIDNSIQVHSCHSTQREVEILRDQLLALFDQNAALEPEDILIMTPDIKTYAPLIEAVFGNSEQNLPKIPFSIDDGFRRESSISDAFLKALDLLQSRFKVTEVMELLEAKPLTEALEITEEELNLIQQWVDDNNIRWGIDGEFKQEKGLPNSDSFTWKKGLSRLLLGYAMKSEGDQIYDQKIPYIRIEGSSQAELAGKLSRLLHSLFDFYERSKQPQKPAEWLRFCLDLLNVLFPETHENAAERSKIRSKIDSLHEYSEASNLEMALPFNVVRSFVNDLFEKSQSGGFRGHGITFGSTTPMRNIPFKVIGMIGMNEGAFPAIKPKVEFDLMRSSPRPGDRSSSADGRYLFLETLMSAKTHFILSYVGQSNMSDTEFSPSIVVSELLHFLEDEYSIEPQQLLTEHRLQPFSPKYFDGVNPKLFSYSKHQLEISKRLERVDDVVSFIDKSLPEPDEEWKHVDIQDLISFFQNTSRYFLQQRLGIYLKETNILTEEREPFEVDGLTRYQIRQELLDRFLKNADTSSYKDIAFAGDVLPTGFAGNRSFKRQFNEAEAFGNEIRKILTQEPNPDHIIELDIDDFRITGKLTSLYESGQWLYRFGSLRVKDKIELWIKHLTYLLSKPDGSSPRSRMLTNDSGDLQQEVLADIENPKEVLGSLLEFYWQGTRASFMFFPDTSHRYAELIEKGNEPAKAAKSSFHKWQSDHSFYPREGEDPYHNFVHRGKNPTEDSSFRNNALKFWQPYFTSTQKVEK